MFLLQVAPSVWPVQRVAVGLTGILEQQVYAPLVCTRLGPRGPSGGPKLIHPAVLEVLKWMALC